MQSILILIVTILQLYMWVIIIGAIMSWLVAFNVINTHNRFVATVMELTYRLTEPVLAPIRRVLPNLGGIDISPVIYIAFGNVYKTFTKPLYNLYQFYISLYDNVLNL